MTGFEPAFNALPTQSQAKTSALAVTSLIFSLILCCPLTTILGPLLGLGALVQIGRNPARKGKGLAFTAIAIGIIATAGWCTVTVWGHKNMNLPVQHGPREALAAGFSGDLAGFRAGFLGEAANTSDQEVQAFLDTLRSRYGEFVSCELDRVELGANPPSIDELMKPVKSYPYLLRFEQATVKASIEFGAQDPLTGEFLWGVKFGTIVVYDEVEGDAIYPPSNGEDGSDPNDVADATPDEAQDDDASPAEDEQDEGVEADTGSGDGSD